MSIKISPEEFSVDIQRRMKRLRHEHLKAARREAAAASRTLLSRRTPVDTGQLKSSWHVTKDGVRNDAPHAGIIEKGARPHKVSYAGIQSLTEWAERQLGLPPEKAKAVAWGIAKRIEREGQQGTYFVEKSMDDIAIALKRAVVRQLKKQAKVKA